MKNREAKLMLGRGAIHEAGHAIAAENLGVRVARIRLVDQQTGRARAEFEKNDHFLKRETIISLAGPLAEEKACGPCPFVAKESDLDHIKACAWTSIDNPGMESLPANCVADKFNGLRQRWESPYGNLPAPLPANVNALYHQLIRDYEPEAKRLLEEHWPRVEQLATELTQRGELSGEEVRTVIAQV